MQSFSKNNLYGLCLRNTLSFIIQFFNGIMQQQRFKHFFKINLYDLTEHIMTANIAGVINLLFISDSKVSEEEQSTLSE